MNDTLDKNRGDTLELWFSILFIVGVVVCLISGWSNWISAADAMAEFQHMTGSRHITIDNHSNYTPVVGNPFNVTFDIRVDGRKLTARCVSGVFKPISCLIRGW